MALLFNTLETMEALVDSGPPEIRSKAIVTAMKKVADANTTATKGGIEAFGKSLHSHIDLAITKQTITFGSKMFVGIGLIGAIIKPN